MCNSLRGPSQLVAFLGILLALLTTPVEAQQKRPRAKFEPAEGKTLMVIGAGWEKDIERYKKATGDTPAGVKLYYYPNGTDTTYFWHCAREENPKGGVVTMMLNLTKGTHGDLKPYLRGEFDEGLNAIGKAIKTWGGPVYVAIEGEVDVQLVRNLDDEDHRIKYTTQEYCDVFRRIHRLWDGLGVDNVAYVWWSICDGMQDRRHYDYYPGDEWVDYIGISLYEPNQVDNAVILKRFADSHRKPMMVMECGPPYKKTHRWEDWHAWFLRACERLDMKLICYNNWGYHPEWFDEFFCNSAFDKLPPSIGKQWGRELKSPRYLHASPGLYLKLGADRGGDGLIDDGDVRAGTNKSPVSLSGDPLLNGKDLTGWTSFFKEGVAQDEDEFSITSKGILSLRGRHEGYVRTDEAHQDFVLTFDWRFPKGGKQSGSGSGVLLALGDEAGWLSQGFEVQIASRNCGDLWVYGGQRFDSQVTEGRFGRVLKKAGNERSIGEWNTYEIRCEGKKIVVELNGKVVNQGTSDRPISGRIGLISQGTEVEFRNLRLMPVAK